MNKKKNAQRHDSGKLVQLAEQKCSAEFYRHCRFVKYSGIFDSKAQIVNQKSPSFLIILSFFNKIK